MNEAAADDVGARHRAALRAADRVVSWRRDSPAEHLARLAAAAEELGVEWDAYGERGAVARLEGQVADLLGKPAAVLLPSGVMAQQSVLRVHCDRAGSDRVALPDLSHLLHHEADGPRLVHGLRLEWLTVGRETPTADHLAKVPGRLGAVLVELPLRDAGCLLPPWDDLVRLSTAARERGVALHADGARLWESHASYERPLDTIAALFDSVYVSLYKGLGAMAGAVVATDEDTAVELRLWRTRMGGTLMRLTPYALGGLLGLRDELPRMGEYLAWARDLAVRLAARGVVVEPEQPHVNTYLVHAPGAAHEVNERLLGLAAREGVVLCGPFRPSDVPGHSVSEVALYGAAAEHDPEVVAEWFTEVVRPPG